MDRQRRRPTVMVLDGDNDNAIQVATELSRDLDVRVIGVGTSDWSRLLRSRYCDVGVTTVPASDPDYAEQLLEVVTDHDPDLLLPIGYHSVAAADRIRADIPDSVTCWLPPSDSFDVAVDKVATAARATELGIDTPETFTGTVTALDERGRPGAVDDLPFPLFLKARHECGKNVTARVEEPSTFWSTYDDLVSEVDSDESTSRDDETRRNGDGDGAGDDGRDVIVQECIPGEHTYACGLLYDDGSPQLLFAHEELRSVPRQGGSGTRVRIFRDPQIETAAIRLLDSLDWHGPALVEFKRRSDGSYVLMEINPKLWASYALASQSGYRFASTCAARALGLDDDFDSPVPQPTAEMVFPLRELYYAARADEESVLRSAAALCLPPVRFDLNLSDIRAWLTPPASVVDSLSTSHSETAPQADQEAAGVVDERANGESPPDDGDAAGEAHAFR